MVKILEKGDEVEGGFFRAVMYADFLLIETDNSRGISNAALNGGLIDPVAVINYSLYGKKDCENKPVEYLSRILEGIGRDQGRTIGLLTAVRPDRFGYARGRYSHCFISLGLDNAASPLDGLSYSGTGINGTINIVILTDLRLTDAALVDAFKTSVEAKSYSLMEKEVRSKFSDRLATGTITDVTAIVSSLGGLEYKYAGTGTDIGSDLSRLVHESIVDIIEKFYTSG